MAKIDKEKLDSLVAEGVLISNVHPRLDLTIYNYSRETQYAGKWDEITTMTRGLVVNSEGEIIARPLPKFFNLGEVRESLPDLPFEVWEKMDGVLGIFFFYRGEPVFASRGNFASEYSIRGEKILEKYNWRAICKAGYTYVFEIIYPELRNIVNYGKTEELFLLAVVETETGSELTSEELRGFRKAGFLLPQRYEFKDYKNLKSLGWKNHEGFVIRFSNNYRVKIKFEEYLAFHKSVGGVNTLYVWEALKNKYPLERLLETIPDEYDGFVKETVKDLVIRYENIEKDCRGCLEEIIKKVGTGNPRVLAEEVKRYRNWHILFMMHKGQDYSEAIWKKIRPAFVPIEKNQSGHKD